VLERGESTFDEALLLPMDRHGYLEETYSTFSYSPIRDDAGGIGGIFCAVTEETARVIGERRLKRLRDVGAMITETHAPAEVCAAAIACSPSPAARRSTHAPSISIVSWLARVDVPQIESALLNLCVNGRDAMAPNGGRLTIETANRWLDDHAAQEREVPPGQYVSLCVTDTGCGMAPEVIERAFEPFFTTKPLGQGTGLGLSMVHGFVRQSGGQVRIYSALGTGTTVCLYLPRFSGEAEDRQTYLPDRAGQGDGETVLVVDDERSVRLVLAEELTNSGYYVIEAPDGPSALRILQSNARIDLMITDVGLPGGLNGRQVADAARVSRPSLKILFITGFAENAGISNGHLESAMQVMTKPFVTSALILKVRELLGRHAEWPRMAMSANLQSITGPACP
jgi:CheY-like chemotaxis protein